MRLRVAASAPYTPNPRFRSLPASEAAKAENAEMLAKRVAQTALGLAVGAGALLTAIAAGAGPVPETGIGLPRDVSAEGHRIDWLIQVTGGFTGVLFVIMCAWIALAVMKHN